MHELHIGILFINLLAKTGRAGVLLQTLHSGGFQRVATVASETSNNVNNEMFTKQWKWPEENEVDGDYLEVDIRRHHGQPKSFIDSRIRQGVLSGHTLVVPFDTQHHTPSGNTSVSDPSRPVPIKASMDGAAGQVMPTASRSHTEISGRLPTGQHAAAQRVIATSGAPLEHPSDIAALETYAHPNTHLQNPAHGTVHGLELLIGILLGMFLSLLAITVMGRWSSKPTRTLLPPQAALQNHGLSEGRLELVQFSYHGARFLQFTWAVDGSTGSYEHNPVPILSDNREVGRVLGRLMASPNGEMYLTSAGSTWAILRKPMPSRHPGQLWDFKVFRANGTPYAVVRQRSAFKCHVEDAVSQRRIMTVIGNFTWPVFLSGEKAIHVWSTQGAAKPSVCARCEARPEMENESLPLSSESQCFHVTTTSEVDASLVLAVLLGLQDVHEAATPRSPSSLPSAGIPQDGAASVSSGIAAGTGAAPIAGPPGTSPTSSSSNDAQGSGSSGQPQAIEEKPPDNEPPRATQPAMAA